MSQLRIKLLGELSVWQEGNRLNTLRSKKGKALLAYLAMTRQSWSRLALAGLFWPDRPEADALRNLRKALHRLNQHIAPYLHITRESVALAEDVDIWVDALEFESIMQVTPPTLSALERADSLYQGAFLEGFYLPDCAEFEDWTLAQGGMIRTLALDAIWRLTNEHRKRGDYERAQRSAQRHITLDELDERGHRDLMEILALQGRRAEALQQFDNCRRILEAELGVEPAPQTIALAERIRDNELIAPATREVSEENASLENTDAGTAAGLPPATPLIGRQSELAALRDYVLRPGGGLVTIVGPGGIGKTSLATALARGESARFADGVYFVPLATLNSNADQKVESAKKTILTAIGAAMGYPFQEGDRDQAKQLHDVLAERQMLLILDNIEHLIAGAGVVADLVRAAPRITVLATSREPLGLYDEQLLPLAGLAYNPDLVSENDPAAQLFLQRVRQHDPGFALRDDDIPYLTRICQTIAGSPLALELAAANLEGLSLLELADELSSNLDLLSTTWSDVPERHRSMRSVLESSWNNLTPQEQHVLTCLSVFRDGFGRDSVQSICTPDMDVRDSQRALASLVRKSLLSYDRSSGRSGRYRMHELLQQFAAEKLALWPEDEAEANRRHSDYFISLLTEQKDHWNTANEESAVKILEQEDANVHKAWEWAMNHEKWSNLATGFYSWQTYHRWKLAVAEFNQLCINILCRSQHLYTDLPVPLLQLRARAMTSLIWSEPDKQKALRMADDALKLLNQVEKRGGDSTVDKAMLIQNTALLWGELGDGPRAVNSLEQSKAFFQEQGMLWEAASADALLAVSDWRTGRYASAISRQERVLATARHLGSKRSETAAAFNLGLFLRSLGQLERAEELQRAAFEEGRRLDYGLALTRYAAGLGRTQLWQGRLNDAKHLLSDALNTARASHFPQYVAWVRSHLAEIQMHSGQYHRARGQLEQARIMLGEQNASMQLPDGGSIHTMLGELALVQGDWTQAEFAFAAAQESLNQPWHQLDFVFSLAGLGRAALGKRRMAHAQRHLEDALGRSLSLKFYPGLVYTLPVVALYFAKRGDEKRSLALWELANTQPFVSRSAWFADVIGRAMGVQPGTMRKAAIKSADDQQPDLWQVASETMGVFREVYN